MEQQIPSWFISHLKDEADSAQNRAMREEIKSSVLHNVIKKLDPEQTCQLCGYEYYFDYKCKSAEQRQAVRDRHFREDHTKSQDD